MGIVRFALRFPYTFHGLAALILFLGLSAIAVMPIYIFPEINIPVVTVIWQYTGLSTPEMEQRVTTYSQYAISTAVSGIKNMEAQTLNGISVQRIFFQPDVNIDLAVTQIVSATNFIRQLLPPGIQAPLVVNYDASSIPVLQLSLDSDNLNEQQLYDYGYYNLRQRLAPVHGVTFPTPDGGKYRQIMVDIDPTKLQAKGLTPTDVVNAVNAQNLTLPSGLAKIGDKQYTVRTNAMPTTIEALNNLPIKSVNDAWVFVRDVGQVRDAFAVQQNIVRQNGKRSVLLSVIKNGNASTLAVVNGVRKALQIARAAAPPGLTIDELFDQAKLVSASVASVAQEGAIAAGLTALMILLFLGSWRSTFIVMISIPLSILSSIIVLHFLGQTINTMTLGGLALAVGRASPRSSINPSRPQTSTPFFGPSPFYASKPDQWLISYSRLDEDRTPGGPAMPEQTRLPQKTKSYPGLLLYPPPVMRQNANLRNWPQWVRHCSDWFSSRSYWISFWSDANAARPSRHHSFIFFGSRFLHSC
jgi:multidrug efflux pump subunit AcrB